MTNLKVLQLLKKYADEAGTVLLENSDARFKHQRQRLSEFSHQLYTRFRLIISELEGDLMTLRERQFDRDMQKITIKVWQDLHQIAKIFNQDKPYIMAQKIIDYVKSRHTPAILENLDFLAKHHLQQTHEGPPSKFHAQFRSIQLLFNLSEYLEKYMTEHPMLPIMQPTPQEELAKIKTTIEPGGALTPADKTAPSIPQAKKQLV